MKFKDKDGNVFEDIDVLHRAFCFGRDCYDCPMNRKGEPLDCVDFCKSAPAEAARLMGYEMVEDWCSQCVRSSETVTSSTTCCFCEKCEDGRPPTNYEPKEANMDKQKFTEPLCRWCEDEFCTNGRSPMKGDYCPVPNTPGLCRFEKRETPYKER